MCQALCNKKQSPKIRLVKWSSAVSKESLKFIWFITIRYPLRNQARLLSVWPQKREETVTSLCVHTHTEYTYTQRHPSKKGPGHTLLTYLRYCSLKHEWFDYLMTAYFLNPFRHHMCLICSSPAMRMPWGLREASWVFQTWREDWFVYSDMHAALCKSASDWIQVHVRGKHLPIAGHPIPPSFTMSSLTP